MLYHIISDGKLWKGRLPKGMLAEEALDHLVNKLEIGVCMRGPRTDFSSIDEDGVRTFGTGLNAMLRNKPQFRIIVWVTLPGKIQIQGMKHRRKSRASP